MVANVSALSSAGRLRATKRTTFEPTGGTSNEATAACSSIVVPFSMARGNACTRRRPGASSPGPTSPRDAPARESSGEAAAFVVHDRTVDVAAADEIH